MELNSFIFPSPTFDKHFLNIYNDELIYIPLKEENKNNYIPCLFLHDDDQISKNFIIYFHGNAEDMFLARGIAHYLYEVIKMNVIIVEYPGYSIYKGESNSEIILENTGIVYDFIKNKFNLEDKNMFVFGRSIGTSPAIYLSSIRKPNALFLVSAFTSIRSVANNVVGPLRYLLKERFISKDYIKNVICPILFIHGRSDPLIPYKETVELKELCTSYSEIVLPEYMTHNDFDLDNDIMEPISQFIKKNIKVDDTKINLNDIKNEIEKLNKMPEDINEYIKNKFK